MTNGSSQGLFVIVAVVIFGIFVVISYLLFRDKLQMNLASIFKDGVTNTMTSDLFFNNSIKEKEYVSLNSYDRAEFVNNGDWNIAPIVDYFGIDKQYKITFEAKTNKDDSKVYFYIQSGSGGKYKIVSMKVNGVPSSGHLTTSTEYQKYECIVEFEVRVPGKNEHEYTNALLGFWGGSSYTSEVFPTIKNVTVEVIK